VLSTSAEELRQIEGVGPHSAFGVRLVQEMAREFLKGKIVNQPFLKSSREIFDYLYHAMRDRKKELFKFIYPYWCIFGAQGSMLVTQGLH